MRSTASRRAWYAETVLAESINEGAELYATVLAERVELLLRAGRKSAKGGRDVAILDKRVGLVYSEQRSFAGDE